MLTEPIQETAAPTPKSLWERVWQRLHDNPIVVVLGILGIVISGLTSFVVNIERIKPLFETTHVKIDPLGEGHHVEGFRGLPIFKRSSDGAKVFTTGATVQIILSRTGPAKDSVSLTWLGIMVDHIPGPIPEYSFRIPEESLRPLGELPASHFEVDLDGDILVATWIDDEGKRVPISTSNILDPDGPKALHRRLESGKSEMLTFALHAQRTGMYVVSFELSVSVNGSPKTLYTEQVIVYNEE